VPLGKLGEASTESFETADGETNPIENIDGSYSNSRFGLQITDPTENQRAELGLPKGVKGALISGVAPQSPAAEKGLKEGMVVIAMASNREDHPVVGAKDLAKRLAEVPPGGTIALKVQSKGRVWLVGLRAREEKK